MSGWYFALGCLAGSVWTLLVTRSWRLRFPKINWPTLRPKYATVVVGDTGNYKIQAIKQIRAVTAFGLKEAKDVSEGVPVTLEVAAARELVSLLRQFGVGASYSPQRRRAK